MFVSRVIAAEAQVPGRVSGAWPECVAFKPTIAQIARPRLGKIAKGPCQHQKLNDCMLLTLKIELKVVT